MQLKVQPPLPILNASAALIHLLGEDVAATLKELFVAV